LWQCSLRIVHTGEHGEWGGDQLHGAEQRAEREHGDNYSDIGSGPLQAVRPGDDHDHDGASSSLKDGIDLQRSLLRRCSCCAC